MTRARGLLLLLLLGACGGAGGGGAGGGTRPGVMPMLSELPGDPTKRDAILDQAAQTPGPEQRKGFTRKEKKAETAAATAAAILGSMFSKTQNVTIGTAGTFDENAILAPRAQPVVGAPAGAGSAAPPPEVPMDGPLVPWIRLK